MHNLSYSAGAAMLVKWRPSACRAEGQDVQVAAAGGAAGGVKVRPLTREEILQASAAEENVRALSSRSYKGTDGGSGAGVQSVDEVVPAPQTPTRPVWEEVGARKSPQPEQMLPVQRQIASEVAARGQAGRR